MSGFIDVLTKLSVFGFPSIVAIIGYVIVIANKVSILMKAQQADMRHDLLKDYHKYMDKGWMTDEEQKDWEDRYQAYHTLGKNGVLAAKREDILHLPNRPPINNI